MKYLFLLLSICFFSFFQTKNDVIKTKIYVDTTAHLVDDSLNNLAQRLEMHTAYTKNFKKSLDSVSKLYDYEVSYDVKNIPTCKGACYLLDTDVRNVKQGAFYIINVKSTNTKKIFTYIGLGMVLRNGGKVIDEKADFTTDFIAFLKNLCVPMNVKIIPDNKPTNKTNIIIKGIPEKKQYAKIINEYSYNCISFYSNECNKGVKKAGKKPLFTHNIYSEKEYNKKITKDDLVLEMDIKNYGKDSLQLDYVNKKGKEIVNNYYIRILKKDLEDGDYSHLFNKNYSKIVGLNSILR